VSSEVNENLMISVVQTVSERSRSSLDICSGSAIDSIILDAAVSNTVQSEGVFIVKSTWKLTRINVEIFDTGGERECCKEKIVPHFSLPGRERERKPTALMV
jgi:hypothetical protein